MKQLQVTRNYAKKAFKCEQGPITSDRNLRVVREASDQVQGIHMLEELRKLFDCNFRQTKACQGIRRNQKTESKLLCLLVAALTRAGSRSPVVGIRLVHNFSGLRIASTVTGSNSKDGASI